MDETAKRIAAARAYASLSQGDLAQILDISQGTFSRIEAGTRHLKKMERRSYLPAIAAACGLPAAWFYADLSRLGEIVTPDEAVDLLMREFEEAADEIDRKA